MIVDEITELTVMGTFDRGVPNQERIVIRVNEPLNIGRYGLLLGVRAAGGQAFPIRDNLLWFGDAILETGDWIFVYTDPGDPKATALPNTNERLYSIHWGREVTVLHDKEIVPILVRVDGVQVV